MGEVNDAPARPVLELLDRDGQVRQVHRIAAWPYTVGRALANDLPLSDPHLAAHHLRFAADADGLHLEVLETANGVLLGARRLRAGERLRLDDGGAPIEISAGRTRLRLRLPAQPLAAERPMAATATRLQRFGPILGAAAVVFGGLAFNTWLESDPDTFVRALAATLMAAVVAIAVWCGLWALLSKTFTRQGHFGWHLKVVLVAGVAWLALAVLPELIAFALSWPWVSDFAFVPAYAVAAAALYFHLLAVEPARPRLMRGVAVVAWASTVAVSLWSNHQRGGRLGAELYMSHLFPPALRLAAPVPVDRFVDGLAPLQAVLDRKAKEAPHEDGGNGDMDVDE